MADSNSQTNSNETCSSQQDIQIIFTGEDPNNFDIDDYDDDLNDLVKHVKSSPSPTPNKKSSCQSASIFLSQVLSPAENHNKSIKYTGLPIVNSRNHKNDSTNYKNYFASYKKYSANQSQNQSSRRCNGSKNHENYSTNYKNYFASYKKDSANQYQNQFSRRCNGSKNHENYSTNYKNYFVSYKKDSTNQSSRRCNGSTNQENYSTNYKNDSASYKNNSANYKKDSTNQYQNQSSRRCYSSTNHENFSTEDYRSPKSNYKNGYDSINHEKYSTDNHQNHSSRNTYENRSNAYYNKTSAKSQYEKHSPKKTHEKRSERNDVYASNVSCNGIISENEEFEEDYEDYDRDETRFDINSRVKERLRIIIQQHPEGIWCSDLPKVYLELSGAPLNFEELGFQSVVQFAFKLPDIFHCVCPTQGGEYKLYNAQKPLPDLKNTEQRCQYSSAEQYRLYDYEDPEPLPTRLDPSVADKLFPEGAMLTAENVRHILVGELCQDKDYEEVVLSEVFNPSFFWIQLRRKLPEFKKFVADMYAFYEDEKERYKLPIIVLNNGLNVACKYAKKWHRGIIKAILPDKSCLIHFYDYGTVKSYKPSELFYLHRNFSSLPAQAIPCGLFNVQPYNSDKWCKEVTWKFIKKASRPLIAEIISKNDEENSALVTLTDTRKDFDFHINHWMRKKKLALPGKVIRKSNSYESQLVAFLLNDFYPKKAALILLMSQSIDLKNLIKYEEDKLPKRADICEEDLVSFSSPKGKVNAQHSPSFSSLNTIPKESPNILNGLPKNLVENNVSNSEMGGKQFIDLQRRIPSQMSPVKYETFLQKLFKSFQIFHSSGDDSENSTKINSQTPHLNNFDAQQKGATSLNYEILDHQKLFNFRDDFKKEYKIVRNG